VKKLLTFLIMLVAGMALFAMPPPGEVTSQITVEAIPQFAGVFAAVTDVSPVMQAESYSFINYFEVSATIEFGVTLTDRQEVNPFYGYSKTTVQGSFDSLRLTFVGWI